MNLLSIALTQIGVTEIRGARHNPTIVKWFKEIKYGGIKNDETAWCSCFINWCALKAGLVRSGFLNARSWLKVGEEIKNPILRWIDGLVECAFNEIYFKPLSEKWVEEVLEKAKKQAKEEPILI